MNDDRDPEGSRADARCAIAGRLVGESLPPPHPSDPRQWRALAAALPGRRRARLAWRWTRRLAVPTLAAVVCLTVWAPGPALRYTARGCGAVAGTGTFTTAADAPGTLDFSDGSQVVLAGGTHGRVVVSRRQAGARLVLDAGAAAIDIVHRKGTRWSVETGPFRVDVRGTAFDVSWSPEARQLRVAMRRGRVQVTGGAITTALPLAAGQVLDVVGDAVTVAAPVASAPPTPAFARPVAVVRPQVPRRAAPARPDPPHADRDSWWAGANDAPENEAPVTKTNSIKTSVAARLVGVATAVTGLAATGGASAASHAGRGSPVSIGENGKLGGPMTGYAWVAAGPGTTIATPSPCNDRGCFTDTKGQLCTHGTIPALVCTEQGTPQFSCNWSGDWGAVIGLDVTAGRGPWHAGAPASVSIAYRGAPGTYRLNVHRASDPDDRVYCVDAYQSGQVIEPRMLKTACWADAGDVLASFDDVDRIYLAMIPGQSAVEFNTCVTGIAVNGSADPTADGSHVTIEDSGKLGGGMNGYAWVAGGAGTSFTMPRTCTSSGCFNDTKGRLCAAGSMAPLVCSGQGTPDLACDWTSNWGALIGLSTNVNSVPWGADAPASVALTFTGARANYRLTAHMAGDPQSVSYCVNNYQSGQTVEARSLRTHCWDGGGVPLTGFQRVDRIGLQIVSSEQSRTFDACITDIVVH